MDDEDDQQSSAFARALREAIGRRRTSLRTLQQRLRDRGYEVSVATLSQWQSGARHPGLDASADVVREIEDLLGLDQDELGRLLVPHRRVPADRNVPFASFMGFEHNDITDESAPRQLSERSSTLISTLDGEGRIVRNLIRNVWQARIEGAREVAVYITIEPGETAVPDVRGVVGCELVDVAVDEVQRVIRPILRLDAPLHRGQLAVAEWESTGHRYEDDLISDRQGIVAVRPEAEVGVLVNFDPAMLPARCWAIIEEDGPERVVPVPLVGTCASHIEFDFGPGSVHLEWEW